jgi:hypothetical protein
MRRTNWKTQLSYDGKQACNEEEGARDAKIATVPKNGGGRVSGDAERDARQGTQPDDAE